MKKNVILIHGFEGRGDQGWFVELKTYLQKNYFLVLNPDFPNSKKPIYKEWEEFFNQRVLPKINSKTIFIAHSLGPTFLMRYFSENEIIANKIIFVAPAVKKNPDFPEIDNFFENFDFLKIKKQVKNIFVIYSDDPYIQKEDYQFLLTKLKIKGDYLSEQQHFTQLQDSQSELLVKIKNILADEIYENRLKKWSKLKLKIHLKKEINFYFRNQEVWWCNLGQNIGFEENGKNNIFERPILVIKKINKNMLLVAPVTSQEKDNKYFYYPFQYKDKAYNIIVSQMRVISSSRLSRKIFNFSDKNFQEVKNQIKEVFKL